MSNDSTSDDVTEEQGIDTEALAVTNTYKILGEFSASNGVGVLGQNNASSGTPIGVQGAVPNSTSGGFGLATPHDARIKGTVTTSTTFTVFADGNRVLRADAESGIDAGNVVAGHSLNEVRDGAVGTVIGGGGADILDQGDPYPNIVTDDHCTVCGGRANQAGDDDGNPGNATEATVAGGFNNNATGETSAILGGNGNVASGERGTVCGGISNEAPGTDSFVGVGSSNNATGRDATVPGGCDNTASGDESFAAGRDAKAEHSSAFVWADETRDNNGIELDFSSGTAGGGTPTGADTFHARSTGGVRFVTDVDNSGTPTAGSYLASGGSSWNTVSARSAKQNITPVDGERVLEAVSELEISRWEYQSREGVDHMGPMAGEFHDAFGLGDDPETIGHVDADGVALAAIQGLSSQLEDAREDIEDKDARIEELEERLAALEARLGAAPQPADD